VIVPPCATTPRTTPSVPKVELKAVNSLTHKQMLKCMRQRVARKGVRGVTMRFGLPFVSLYTIYNPHHLYNSLFLAGLPDPLTSKIFT